ncbi:MAG: aminomethyl-transferring glycine dehydrogenase subunit GcvPA [Firmicutes bacterium]|nr:aminomethyl-transferring glycine dehydrogenase subunit GcvPA [Bacillota bacterium]
MSHPYLPLTDRERQVMLARIGVTSFDDLITDIPDELRLCRSLNLQTALSEVELRRKFEAFLSLNQHISLSFLGAGAYQHFIPTLVDHLANRSEFYTAYTPYQPEISQGFLQAIFEYQTLTAGLFGLPVTNASLYDGPTALAESVLMVAKETKLKRFLIPSTLNPILKQILLTYTKPLGIELVSLPHQNGLIDLQALKKSLADPTAALVIQNPNFFGIVEDYRELINIAKANGTLVICYVHPLLLGILEAPGKLGADIVVAEGQPLGNPISYGGPNLGMIAASERFLRKMPGRLVGETIDHQGKRCFVLTLQTREQHIRREKATSNICSNQALCALRTSIYLSTLGPDGFKDTASRAYNNAHYLYTQLVNLGLQPLYEAPFFIEFPIKLPQSVSFYLPKLLQKGIVPGPDLGELYSDLNDTLLICATEIFTKAELDNFVTELGGLL